MTKKGTAAVVGALAIGVVNPAAGAVTLLVLLTWGLWKKTKPSPPD